MKKILSLVAMLCITMQMSAQIMKDIISSMPDSITPLLTKNNKLDFIDYLGANQKAEEKNLLGGNSEMTKLTDTRAVIKMSSAATMDIKLLKNPEPQIGIITTMKGDEKAYTSIVEYYTMDWKLIKKVIPEGFKKLEWNDDNEQMNETEYKPLEIKLDNAR